jgi:hypothetical protein
MSNQRIFCFAVAYVIAAMHPWLGCAIGLFFCLMEYVENN